MCNITRVCDITKLNEASRTFSERAKQQSDASTYLDEAEFDPLYMCYRRKILAYCNERIRNLEEAEEASQDAFLKILRSKWKRFPDRPLLYRLAYQACCDILRKHPRIKIEYLDGVGDGLVSDMPDPEEEALRIERRSELTQALAQAISQLPAAQRNLIRLEEYHGLSTKEIAETLNITEGTVRNYRYLAYVRLRASLDIGG